MSHVITYLLSGINENICCFCRFKLYKNVANKLPVFAPLSATIHVAIHVTI
jgi:hypothetical protein